jgi:hypothetical protein
VKDISRRICNKTDLEKEEVFRLRNYKVQLFTKKKKPKNPMCGLPICLPHSSCSFISVRPRLFIAVDES